MPETTVAISLKKVTHKELTLLLNSIKMTVGNKTGELPTNSEILKMGILLLAKKRGTVNLEKLYYSVKDEDTFTEWLKTNRGFK